ncbi:MAG: helix-turn-helix transcriptional regulator [Clostridia bacterium]|nr:helix-turn-helix transcriptional regulator [Clostridia bacterium]
MNIVQLNPFLRYARMHETYYPQKENSVCYDCRLFYILQGEGTLFAGGQNFNVSKGGLIFLPPKTQYRFRFSNNDAVKIYVLNFDLISEFCAISRSLGTATESSFDPTRVPAYPIPKELSQVLVEKNSLQIQGHIAACVELFLHKISYYKHSASAHLKLALLELLREYHSEKTEYRLVQSVQEFIRNNYQNAELDNSAIAAQFNYHSYHLNRLMKAHTDQTLHEYLTQYRLHMAKNFLTTTTLNVTTIAEKTGFSSYTYFIKLFRERTGISPLQYRKTHKNIGF